MTAPHDPPDRPRAPSATRTDEPPSLAKVAIMLAVIGVALGGPSFLFAVEQFNASAVITGVGFIYLGLLYFFRTTYGKNQLCDRATTLSIVTALIIRVVTIPIGVVADIFTGLIAVEVSGLESHHTFVPGHPSFVRTLIATFIQAGIILFAFLLVVAFLYPIHRNRLLKKDKSGLCIRCGYDLRATRDRCPECGSTVPVGHQPSQPSLAADS